MESSNLFHSTKKEDRRVSRTKRNINFAFLQLMKQKGISKITIKELCDLADINRKTFYTYFNTVDDVLSEIENEIINDFQNRIMKLKIKKSLTTIQDIFHCIGDLISSNSKFIHQLVQVDELEGLEKKVKQTIKNAIIETISLNHESSEDIFNLSLEYAISGAVSMYIDWFSDDRKIPLTVLSDLTCDLVKQNIDYAISYSGKEK